jgi:hypothetical protein
LALRKQAEGIKSWVQRHDAAATSTTADIDVDEVRVDGNRRLHFRLQKIGTGWLIVDMDEPRPVPARIPYGTHVSKVPDEPPLAPQR